MSPLFRVLRPAASVLFAFATLAACQTQLDSKLTGEPGHRVEFVDAGTGRTTVVFESGFQNDWTPWDDVASEVARKTRVFAYSRPGFGDSDRTSTPRDPSHIVEDLRALLASRGIAPPYVLVGHSFGGTYMELLAKAYPDEVAGLVLVDPRHRDFTPVCEEANIGGCSIPADVVAGLPAPDRAEFAGFASASEEIRAAGPFGSYPVRVLTATAHSASRPWEDLWKSLLGELADEAEDGEQVVFSGAGHYLQIEKSHRVAAIILELVSSVPAEAP